jgi:hypothetical protein
MGGPLHPASPGGASFELERLEFERGRLVVSGWWFGVRGLRFVRPALVVKGRKVLATLEHKPWATSSDGPWTAAFPWKEGVELDVGAVMLVVAPSVEVPLDREVVDAEAAPSTPPPADPPDLPDVRQTLRDELRALERQLAELREALAVADEHEAQHRAAQARSEEAIAQRGDAVVRREEAIVQRGDAVARREEALARRGDAVARSEEAIAQRDDAVARRHEAIAQRDDAVARRREAIAQRDDAEARSEEALARRDDAEAQRDEAFAEREAVQAGRDEALAEREAVQARRKEALARRDDAEARCQEAIVQRDDARTQRDEILFAHRALQKWLDSEWARSGRTRPPTIVDAPPQVGHEPTRPLPATEPRRPIDRARASPFGVRAMPAVRAIVAHLHRGHRAREQGFTKLDLWAAGILAAVAALSFVWLLVTILTALFVF